VRRIDELFAIEREINGKPPDVRRAVRQERSKPLVAALDAYMREQFRRLSPKNDVAKAIGNMLTRWFVHRFLDDCRIHRLMDRGFIFRARRGGNPLPVASGPLLHVERQVISRDLRWRSARTIATFGSL
jgi:hypothetical protein